MPTYTVTAANVALSRDQKARIAEAITEAHSAHTGAPGFFAQVLFPALDASSHFIGGKPNRSAHIFVHGLIRGGRTTVTKQGLMKQVVDRVCGIAGVESEDVWIYLQDLAETQMIEFGRLLPEPGAEDEWRRKITPKKLADLARDGVEV